MANHDYMGQILQGSSIMNSQMISNKIVNKIRFGRLEFVWCKVPWSIPGSWMGWYGVIGPDQYPGFSSVYIGRFELRWYQ